MNCIYSDCMPDIICFNRMPFVSNSWTYELFGTKWDIHQGMCLNPTTAPQTGIHILHSEAAELLRGRGFHHPVTLKSCILCSWGGRGGQPSLPPGLREQSCSELPLPLALVHPQLSQPDTTHCSYLACQELPKQRQGQLRFADKHFSAKHQSHISIFTLAIIDHPFQFKLLSFKGGKKCLLFD